MLKKNTYLITANKKVKDKNRINRIEQRKKKKENNNTSKTPTK